MQPWLQGSITIVIAGAGLQVDLAFAELSRTLESLLQAVEAQARQNCITLSANDRPRLHVAKGSSAVWLAMPVGIVDRLGPINLGSAGWQKLVKPQQDGADLRLRNVFTCEALDVALAKYGGAWYASSRDSPAALLTNMRCAPYVGSGGPTADGGITCHTDSCNVRK